MHLLLLLLLLFLSLPATTHAKPTEPLLTYLPPVIVAARDNDLPALLSILRSKPIEPASSNLPSSFSNPPSPGSFLVDVQNSAGGSALQWAAHHGNLEMVDALVASGANVNLSNRANYTPLIHAIMNQHSACALFLIREKADVNQKTIDTHSTALHYASWHGMTEVVETLIDNGADMMASDKHGHRSISIANGEGHRELREMIGKRSGETL